MDVAVFTNKINQRLAKGQTDMGKFLPVIEEDYKTLRDYIVKPGEYRFVNIGNSVHLINNDYTNPRDIADCAIAQIADKYGIPTGYANDLFGGTVAEKDILTNLLNMYNDNMPIKNYLVRETQGKVRGFLSPSYRRMDSREFLKNFMNIILQKQMGIASAIYTDRKFFVEAISTELVTIESENNGLIPLVFGVRMQNSDFGHAAVGISSFILQLKCNNGLVGENVLRQVHIGRDISKYSFDLSERTMLAYTKATTLELTDVTEHVTGSNYINDRIEIIRASTNKTVDPNAVLSRRLDIQKEEKEEIKQILVRSSDEDGCAGESTMWKLVNAITAVARNKNEERSRDLQEIGGKMLFGKD